MRRAFDNASMAYDRRDGAAARSHADDGHAFKAEARRCVEERRRLVAEIRAARDRHAGPKADFQRAKADFTAAKQRFDQAKAEHERAKDEFQRAKREFDAARQAFKARLDKVRAERNRRREDDRDIALKAGVPIRYIDDIKVVRQPDGNVSIYFGGIGKPDGTGHAHYVVDGRGNVTYLRKVGSPYGSQNFTDGDDQSGGGTLYDRRVRAGRHPLGVANRDNATKVRDSVFYDRSRRIDLHVTQYYDDNRRVSWDTDGRGDRGRHWTDQSFPYGHPNRGLPPEDGKAD